MPIENKTKDPSELISQTITEADGQQYFIYGKTRIKIIEHFPDNGPTLEDALLRLVQQKIRENALIIA